MIQILENIMNTLTTDSTLTALCPASNMFTGVVDVSVETQASLLYPQITLSTASEVGRTVPLNARDTIVQIDIWSRQSQLEVENIYERVVTLLNYDSGNQGSAHLFWERLGSAIDMYESTDRRYWRKTCSFKVWATST